MKISGHEPCANYCAVPVFRLSGVQFARNYSVFVARRVKGGICPVLEAVSTGDKIMRYSFSLAVLLVVIAALGCQTAPVKNTDSPTVVTEKGVSEITPEQALPAVEAAYSQFIDVRTPEEFAAGHAYRARNIPLDELTANLDRLEKNEPVYLICQSGRRSKEAAEILVKEGFAQAISIEGGTAAWEDAGLPMAK